MRTLSIPIVVLILFVIARFVFLGGNFSRFVVAGSDFIQIDPEHPNLIINDGQGYDGQFFYRYAHNPLDSSKTAFGVTVDHRDYRIQRILYPSIVWVCSLGGNPSLIPFFLVFCNVLAFIGIFYISIIICNHMNSNQLLALLPLFLFGGYMALARDTSELFEVFFVVLAVYYIIKERHLLLLLSIMCSIFSRETSLIAIIPLTFVYLIKIKNEENSLTKFFIKAVISAIPFVSFLLWKYYIHTNIPSTQIVAGSSQNLGWPFLGMYQGAIHNLNFSGYKSILESIFWFTFFSWNVWFSVIVIQRINFKEILKINEKSMLSIAYLCWLLFSLFLSRAIYIDDWAFVRVFSLFNMLGFLILMLSNRSVNRFFIFYSLIVTLLLIIRLVIRV